MDNIFELALSLTIKEKKLVIREFEITSESKGYISFKGVNDYQDIKGKIKKSKLNSAFINDRVIKTSKAIYVLGWSDKDNLNKIETNMWEILTKRFHEIQEGFNILQRIYLSNEVTKINK